MELGAYEVGNHMNGVGGTTATRAFLHAFSVSAQMGAVYAATIAALRTQGFDGPMAMSVECRLPDANVCHGLQRWLGDRNPAWTAVAALMEPVVVPTPTPYSHSGTDSCSGTYSHSDTDSHACSYSTHCSTPTPTPNPTPTRRPRNRT